MFDIELSNEHQRWRARDVTFYRGAWPKLRETIPDFETAPFRSDPSAPENPYLRIVIRKPVSRTENPIPIATVSPSYALAPHKMVSELCIEGLRRCGVAAEDMTFEVGLSALSEWMNLRIQLPDEFSLTDRLGEKTALRLECFNSVDGSSRLIIVFGWLCFICANGLIIGETMIEIRERHDGRLELDEIPGRIESAFDRATSDRDRRLRMDKKEIRFESLEKWVNGRLSDAWGKKAAARVFHICDTGSDVEFSDPFAKGAATEKPVVFRDVVPGSPPKAATVYDVMQAMSFVASSRVDAIDRHRMLLEIDNLLYTLENAA